MARTSHGWRPSLALLSVAAAVALTACSAATVTAFRLQHDAEQVRSLAADGALLALGAQRHDVTDAFVRVHAAELAAEAEDLRTVLASPSRGPRAPAPPPRSCAFRAGWPPSSTRCAGGGCAT